MIFEADQLKNGYFTRLNEFENHQRFQFRKFNVGARQKFFQTFSLICSKLIFDLIYEVCTENKVELSSDLFKIDFRPYL